MQIIHKDKIENIPFWKRSLEDITIDWSKNGYYIPPIHAFLYYMTGDIFLSTAIAMKIYPANYFYWFGENYEYFSNRRYNWIKQFVRLTDTGYLASFIYILYPQFLPIAYNVHFVITTGYWLGKISFNMNHIDLLDLPDLNRSFELTWSNFNHGLPLVLLTYRLITSDICYEQFTLEHLKWSYYWMYTWLFVIYLPWRLTTGDCVYGILSYETPLKKKILFITLIHGLVILGNSIGWLLR